MTTVTIYTKPGCGACTFTKRALELGGIPHRVHDIDTDTTAAAAARQISDQLGTTQLPVVVCDDGRTWAGLQLHRVAELVREAEELHRAWSADAGDVNEYPWNAERHSEVMRRVAP